MRLVIARPARRDLDDIVEYIAKDDAPTAENVLRRILASIRQLRDFPNLGHPGSVHGTRELSVRSLPYVVVYRVGNSEVTVLAVFHGARDFARILHKRLAGKD